jgi:serine protease Do
MLKKTGFVTACILAALARGVWAAPSDPLDGLDFRQVVRDARDKVFPTVVYIKCLRESHEEGKKTSQEVAGSGVIISAEAEVLTNWHVIDKATEVRCLLYDGTALDARVVGSDKDTDLALLKLRTAERGMGILPMVHGQDARATEPGVPFAEMGDSTRLTEGNFVMAMGAPWGLSRSVSIGIISSTRRYLPENSEYSLWLQTDAAISPGNSGGPLVNTDGQVIGINSRGVMYGGDMGFAVPTETIRIIVPQLRTHGRVNWAYLGLQLQPLRDFERNIYFEGEEGVIVAETDPDSPARNAGIRPRDRICAVNGQPVTALTSEDLPALRCKLGMLPKGEPVELQIQRGQERLAVQLTPAEKGDVEGTELDCPRWDLTVKTINRFDNPDLYFHRPAGVSIFGIKHPGNAATAGFRTDDIILSVDAKEVKTLDDIRKIHAESLENIDKKPRLVVSILRNGLFRQVVLDIARNYEKN